MKSHVMAPDFPYEKRQRLFAFLGLKLRVTCEAYGAWSVGLLSPCCEVIIDDDDEFGSNYCARCFKEYEGPLPFWYSPYPPPLGTFLTDLLEAYNDLDPLTLSVEASLIVDTLLTWRDDVIRESWLATTVAAATH